MSSFYLLKKIDSILQEEISFSFKLPHPAIRCCLVYPNTYFVGMSSLGYQTIYSILNSHQGSCAERCFLPDKDEIPEYIRTGTPLISYETKTPLYEFDIVFFSISWEVDFLNVPKILKLSKIPLYSTDRDDRFPLIACGGITTSINIEPISLFFDFFAIGEGEELIYKIVSIYKEKFFLGRKKILKKLAEVEGIYVPSEKVTKRKRIKRQVINNLDIYRTYSVISTPLTEFKNCFLLEVSRGCRRYCYFCIVPFCCAPYRTRSVENLLSCIKDNIKNYSSVGLVGASLSDYPYLNKLLKILTDENIRVQFSSTGVDFIEKVETKLLKKAKVENLTVAIEVGSDKLRKTINKKINIPLLMNFLKNVDFLKQIKFYFMIGLPGEDEKDILEMINLIKSLRYANNKIKMIASISVFVPKPRTPFALLNMDDKKTLKDKINFIKNELKECKVILDFESIRFAYLEGILSHGTRELGHLLVDENFTLEKLKRESYLGREKTKYASLPWDLIEV